MGQTRRNRRGGRNRRPEREPIPTRSPERELPDGVQPSPFPGGGFVWECPSECGYGCWRATLPEIMRARVEHGRKCRNRQRTREQLPEAA